MFFPEREYPSLDLLPPQKIVAEAMLYNPILGIVALRKTSPVLEKSPCTGLYCDPATPRVVLLSHTLQEGSSMSAAGREDVAFWGSLEHREDADLSSCFGEDSSWLAFPPRSLQQRMPWCRA